MSDSDTDREDFDAADDYAEDHAEEDQPAAAEALHPPEDDSDQVNVMIIVPDAERISSNLLSKYEFARLIGTRAQQIDQSGMHFADLGQQPLGAMTAMDVAILELLQKSCPLLIKRLIGTKHVEVLNPNDMILPKVPLKSYIN